MTLYELLNQVKSDHEKILETSRDQLAVHQCFKVYTFKFRGHPYTLRFNLLTLDFVAKSKMPVSLRAKIRSRIIRSEYLKWKFKKEGRAFFDFLRLNYKQFHHIVFTDCESPDFIIHNKHGDHGYEVTEATDAHNAKFNEAVYLLTGMDHQSTEFRVYINQIQRSLTNKRRNPLSVKQRRYYDSDELHQHILQCIIKKVKKYEHYDTPLDTRNIIVFNNRIGFRRRHDFESISQSIKNEACIATSNIDRIYMISGTHDVLVAYDKYGKVLKIEKKSI